MNFLRLKVIFAFTLILLCKSIVFSQDMRRQAEENPLSTVLYLLSTTEKDSSEEEKACLAKSFAIVERFSEIEDTVKMVEEESYVDETFVALTTEMIAAGKVNEASMLTTFLIIKAVGNEYILQKLFKPLILLKRDGDAIGILNKFSDSDKVDGAFELTKIYLELGQSVRALEIIGSITNLAENSKYGEDKATLGFYYAKLGREPQALRFSQESMKNLIWKSGTPEYTEGRILTVVIDTYRALGKHGEANEILARQGKPEKIEEPENLIKTAEKHFVSGNHAKAYELINQSLRKLNPKDYSDSFDLGNLIDIYLKRGEMEKAEAIAKNLSGSDYMQQKQLLNIADVHIRKQHNSKASEILRFALEQTKKIDTGEDEDGRLWTSGKCEQAQYRSQIALRFIEIRSDKKTLELISQIKKPYLRALALTQFVGVNKNRLPSSQLKYYLEEALSLLRQKKVDIFDSKKFDILAITARKLAEIKMN